MSEYKIAIHPQYGEIKFCLSSGVTSLDSEMAFNIQVTKNKIFFVPAEYTGNVKTFYPIDGWIIDGYEDETYSKRTERLDYSAFKTYALN